MEESAKSIDAYISLKNPKNYEIDLPELLGASNYTQLRNYDGEFKYDYDINNELLRWEVFAFSDSTVTMLFSVAGVVIFIIIFTSVFCIRNSFAISITEKMKMYGMLSSVGATKKQIKKNVIQEAMVLGMIRCAIRCNFRNFSDIYIIKNSRSINSENTYLKG